MTGISIWNHFWYLQIDIQPWKSDIWIKPMNFQKWKTVHAHHLHEYNLLLLPANVKQNHAKEAKLRAAQSIVKAPGPQTWGYTTATEKELGTASGNRWESGQSWVTHLKSLSGGSGISIDIIYFNYFLLRWRMKEVERLAQGYPTSVQGQSLEKKLYLLNPTQFNWNPSPSKSYRTQIQFASSISTLKP